MITGLIIKLLLQEVLLTEWYLFKPSRLNSVVFFRGSGTSSAKNLSGNDFLCSLNWENESGYSM